ncbi:MAG: hypothetical protein D6702_11925, partial [Planctomycetota bacterium]
MRRLLLSALALTAPLTAQESTWEYRGAAGEAYGAALAAVGDWNRDGIPDWAAGAPYGAADDGTNGGYVLVHSGRNGDVIRRIGGGGGEFGAALAGAGDVDRDGLPDLLVGAPRADGDAPASGRAEVRSGADGSLLLEFRGGAPWTRFGAAVAGIGDADGDGVPDLLVGAPGDSRAGREAGAVTLFSGADGRVLVDLLGPGPLARFGAAVCGLGDVDADGRDDFAVGAPGAGEDEAGAVLLYSGASGSLIRMERGARPGGAFGAALA